MLLDMGCGASSTRLMPPPLLRQTACSPAKADTSAGASPERLIPEKGTLVKSCVFGDVSFYGDIFMGTRSCFYACYEFLLTIYLKFLERKL
jgi:hypothetical protein